MKQLKLFLRIFLLALTGWLIICTTTTVHGENTPNVKLIYPYTQTGLDNGGVDYPFVEPVSNKPDAWTIASTVVACLGLIFITILAALLINSNNKIQKLNGQVSKCKENNEKLVHQIKKLEEINQALDETAKRYSSGERPDMALESLLGLAGGSSIDLLSEAQRILYWKNKRSSDETAKDANGFLITLLRSVVTATGIRPIAAFQQIVQFDERYHTCYTEVARGEQVRVVETGWVKGNEIIKKAVVEKR